MKKESEILLKKFRQAFKTLKEGVLSSQDQLQKDGVIKRFEYTYELLWKTLKAVLEEKNREAGSPAECLEESLQQGWLKDEHVYKRMLKDRNSTVHGYDQEVADQIFRRIRKEYVRAFEKAIQSLEEQTGMDRLREPEEVYSAKHIWMHKAKSFEEAKQFDRDYYASMSPEDRLATVQFLRSQNHKLRKGRGRGASRKGLRRVVTVIQHKKPSARKKDLSS